MALSGDSLAEADELASTGLSVVTILSSDYGRKDGEGLSAYRTRRRGLPNHTPGGLRIAICPATYLDVTCVECQVCSRPRVNGTVMGFPAHANRSAFVDAVFMANGLDPGELPKGLGSHDPDEMSVGSKGQSGASHEEPNGQASRRSTAPPQDLVDDLRKTAYTLEVPGHVVLGVQDQQLID